MGILLLSIFLRERQTFFHFPNSAGSISFHFTGERRRQGGIGLQSHRFLPQDLLVHSKEFGPGTFANVRAQEASFVQSEFTKMPEIDGVCVCGGRLMRIIGGVGSCQALLDGIFLQLKFLSRQERVQVFFFERDLKTKNVQELLFTESFATVS